MARTACFVACARADWGEANKLADEALVLGHRAGVLDVVLDASLAGISARTYVGDIGGALGLRDDLADVELPPRGQLAFACASALTLLRAGKPGGSLAELAHAESLAEQFGGVERLLLCQARAEVLLDAGRPHEAEPVAAEARAAAEAAALTLLELQVRLLECRIHLAAGRSVGEMAARALADAERLGAVPLAELARVLAGQSTEPPAAGIEARAHWYEQQALSGAPGAWEQAHDEWAKLGHTIWPQRALLARDLQPRTQAELAAIPLTPLIDDLTQLPTDA